jgi:hypothetical protein
MSLISDGGNAVTAVPANTLNGNSIGDECPQSDTSNEVTVNGSQTLPWPDFATTS